MMYDSRDVDLIANVFDSIADDAEFVRKLIVESVAKNIYVFIGKTIFANYLLKEVKMFSIAELHSNITSVDAVNLIVASLKNVGINIDEQGKESNYAIKVLIKKQLDTVAFDSIQKFVAIQKDQDNILNMNSHTLNMINSFLQMDEMNSAEESLFLPIVLKK